MAKIGKYVLVMVVVAAVVAATVYAATEVDLFAGALVALGALILVMLVVRFQAARAEKSGIDDWKDVVDADAPDDAFFSDWTSTRTSPDPTRPDTELVVDAHTGAGLESLQDLAPEAAEPLASAEAPAAERAEGVESLPLEAPVEALPVEPLPVEASDDHPDGDAVAESHDGPGVDAGESFPWDDPSDGWGDLPPLVPRRPTASDGPELTNPAGDPSTGGTDVLGEPAAPVRPGVDDTRSIEPAVAALADTGTPTGTPSGPDAPEPDDPRRSEAPTFFGDLSSPPFEPAPSPISTDAMSLAGATSSSRPRRSVIDWTGPVHTVDEQVRTSDDILKASAATALPSPDDQPAPVAGSELARLLSKVEARLRDYE